MKKSKKVLRSLNLKIGILVLAGLAVFISTGYLLNNTLNTTDSSAGYQVKVGYGKSATISTTYKSTKVSANVTVKSDGKGDYTLMPVTPKLQCTKRSGFFTCVFSTNPGVIVLYASHTNVIGSKSVPGYILFTVK